MRMGEAMEYEHSLLPWMAAYWAGYVEGITGERWGSDLINRHPEEARVYLPNSQSFALFAGHEAGWADRRETEEVMRLEDEGPF